MAMSQCKGCGQELKADVITGWVDVTDHVVKGCYSQTEDRRVVAAQKIAREIQAWDSDHAVYEVIGKMERWDEGSRSFE